MIKVCLMKLGFKWVSRHPLRYILSWISFAIAGLVLICAYSVASGISEGITSQLSVNPLKYQIHVKNQRIEQGKVKNDLTVEKSGNILKETAASEMRILYEPMLSLESVNAENTILYTGKIAAFHVQYPLLLMNEIAQGNVMYPENVVVDAQEAVVTEQFLGAYGLSAEQALGIELIFVDSEKTQYPFTIVAVISGVMKGCILEEAGIYLAYDEVWGEGVERLEPSMVSFDFAQNTDMEAAGIKISKYGYPYTDSTLNIERLKALSDGYAVVGTILGVVLFLIVSMSLVNSIMITINENASFIKVFCLLGLTHTNKRFLICFMAAVQGIIGGILGVIVSLIVNRQVAAWMESFNSELFNCTLGNFGIDAGSCVVVMIICITVSVVTGIAAAEISPQNMILVLDDNELV